LYNAHPTLLISLFGTETSSHRRSRRRAFRGRMNLYLHGDLLQPAQAAQRGAQLVFRRNRAFRHWSAQSRPLVNGRGSGSRRCRGDIGTINFGPWPSSSRALLADNEASGSGNTFPVTASTQVDCHSARFDLDDRNRPPQTGELSGMMAGNGPSAPDHDTVNHARSIDRHTAKSSSRIKYSHYYVLWTESFAASKMAAWPSWT